MNHRERLLDIANEAIDKLMTLGVSQAHMCRVAGVSPYAFRGWRHRLRAPTLDVLEPLLNIAGLALELRTVDRVVPRALLSPPQRVGTPRKVYVTSARYMQAAERLGVFSLRDLADAVGATPKAAKNWTHRYRNCLVEERREPARGGGRVIWRWVGEQVAQPMAAE